MFISGKDKYPRHESAGLSSTAHHQRPRAGHIASDDAESSRATASGDNFQNTPSTGIGTSNERSSRQVRFFWPSRASVAIWKPPVGTYFIGRRAFVRPSLAKKSVGVGIRPQTINCATSRFRLPCVMVCYTFSKAKSEDEPAGHSHLQKEKDRTKLKKRDDKAYRAAPKQLLGEIRAATVRHLLQI